MRPAHKNYEHEFHEGAGHAFLQRQNEREGANRNATIKAWPRAIRFLKQHLGNDFNCEFRIADWGVGEIVIERGIITDSGRMV